MALPKTYNFKEQYRGDTFYPSVDGSPSGLLFRLKEKDSDSGFDGLDIIIRFKTQNGYVGKVITTDDGITRMGNGYYRIDSFKVTMDAGTYNQDWQITFLGENIITGVRGVMKVNPDI